MPNVEIPNGELNSFDLPRVCVVTGSREGVVFKPVKFAWYPRWIMIFAPFALLIAAILAQIMTKRVKGELPFTEEAWRKWRLGKVVFPLSVIGGLALLFGAMFALLDHAESLGGLLLLAAIGLPSVVGLTLFRGRGPVVQKITDTHITLKLPSSVAAEAIFGHLIGGSRRPSTAAIQEHRKTA